jgi:hypothetical protein
MIIERTVNLDRGCISTVTTKNSQVASLITSNVNFTLSREEVLELIQTLQYLTEDMRDATKL